MTASSLAPRLRSSGFWPTAIGHPIIVLGILGAILCSVAVAAATIGAAGIPFDRLIAALDLTPGNPAFADRAALILWSIRLPRIALAVVIGGLWPPLAQ